VGAVRSEGANRPRITYDNGAQLTIFKGRDALTDIRRESTNVVGVGGRHRYTETGYCELLQARVVICNDALTVNSLVSTSTLEVAYNLANFELTPDGKDDAGHQINRISKLIFNHRAGKRPDLVFIRHTSGINADLLVLQEEQELHDDDHAGQEL